MSKNIRIALVSPSHPGNVGAAARAMKTMNLTDLCLVNPRATFPCAEATARAAGADSILKTCTITDSLDEALKDCQIIIGTSARLRHLPVKMLDPRQCGERIKQDSENKNVAILFGREHAGLTNDELHRCHYHVHIPSNPEYSSLNLAAAVQIICYEVRMAFLDNKFLPEEEQHDELASDKQVQMFYHNLEQLLVDIDFLKNTNPRKLMPRLKRLFNRAQIDNMEYDLLMGILTKIAYQLKTK